MIGRDEGQGRSSTGKKGRLLHRLRPREGEDGVLSGGCRGEPGRNPSFQVAGAVASPRGATDRISLGWLWWQEFPMQSNLEKELKEWRESRNRDHAAAVEARVKTFATHNEHRRVKVNGQEVVVVSRAKRSS
jgi:hypothetical protein